MVSRRRFLHQASAFTLGFTGLQSVARSGLLAAIHKQGVPDGFGPLQPDPEGVLDLPEGFSYQIISRAGDPMDDGFVVPGLADGMAAFPGPNGQTVIVRNHEISDGAPAEYGPFGANNHLFAKVDSDFIYDEGREAGPCLGGTTTLVYDTQAQQLIGQHLSLVGTVRNCAGGPTSWNTWITCEETTVRAGATCAHDHGFPFEVPASATPGLARPVPLKDMGRFNHEAVALDPASGIVYQTEDAHDGLIYRYIPNVPGQLARGGRLQALCAADAHSLDTRNWGDGPEIATGTTFATRWIDLDDILAPEDDLRLRGFEQGAARFARGEGMWEADGTIYFACTNGGEKRKGQIWRYTPGEHEGNPFAPSGTLELFVEPNDGSLIENADNLTVSPWGDLIVCEDGSGDQFLVGVTPEGALYKFAHNAVSDSEFAGATFSPDGSTLFVNIQVAGLTLAITGPWKA